MEYRNAKGILVSETKWRYLHLALNLRGTKLSAFKLSLFWKLIRNIVLRVQKKQYREKNDQSGLFRKKKYATAIDCFYVPNTFPVDSKLRSIKVIINYTK